MARRVKEPKYVESHPSSLAVWRHRQFQWDSDLMLSILGTALSDDERGAYIDQPQQAWDALTEAEKEEERVWWDAFYALPKAKRLYDDKADFVPPEGVGNE